MVIKLKQLHPDAVLPRYDHVGDAGLALFSVEEITLQPNKRRGVGIGWAIEFSAGYVARILGRSGLALDHGINCALAGVIDSNYRGEWKVIILNSGDQPYQIKKGDKIAQAVFIPIVTAKIELAEELTYTSRGADGFGSTGRT